MYVLGFFRTVPEVDKNYDPSKCLNVGHKTHAYRFPPMLGETFPFDPSRIVVVVVLGAQSRLMGEEHYRLVE